jgi:hypothetical protein
MRGPNRLMRQRIENAIEAMIEALDALDPDGEAEPSLGSVAVAPNESQEYWAAGNRPDIEHDPADGPEGDDEYGV